MTRKAEFSRKRGRRREKFGKIKAYDKVFRDLVTRPLSILKPDMVFWALGGWCVRDLRVPQGLKGKTAMKFGVLCPGGQGCARIYVRAGVLTCILAFAAVLGAGPVQAAGGQQDALVVVNDRGGLLDKRSAEINHLAVTGQRVELRGTCLSACTMYLSLANVCIGPKARFGFHGPSWFGKPLERKDFDYWSREMARHYREPLRSWYMRSGRYRIEGYYRLTGAEIIRMGYPPC